MNGFGQEMAIHSFNSGYKQCKEDLEEKIKQLKTYGWNMDKTLISLEDVIGLLEDDENEDDEYEDDEYYDKNYHDMLNYLIKKYQ